MLGPGKDPDLDQELDNIGANLGHLIGYDAGYYGYMWSLVFATDMFQSRFQNEGILNPQTGMDYRNMILRPGNYQMSM